VREKNRIGLGYLTFPTEGAGPRRHGTLLLSAEIPSKHDITSQRPWGLRVDVVDVVDARSAIAAFTADSTAAKEALFECNSLLVQRETLALYPADNTQARDILMLD
jgi:hypothetical protein